MKTDLIYIDYLQYPHGVTCASQFGFVVENENYDCIQKGYRFQIASDLEFECILYDSGVVPSVKRTGVSLSEVPLRELKKYYIRVGIKTEPGGFSGFGKPMGFITAKEKWMAPFLTPDTKKEDEKSAAKLMRMEFDIEKDIESAILCSTALGIYHTWVNGTRTHDYELAPGFTSYHKHLLYQTSDVTNMVQKGRNCIGVMVGAGWYKGEFGFLGLRNNFGCKTAFSCEMEVCYADGTSEIIGTNKEFQCCDAPVVFSEIYDGEIYDARLEQPGWNKVGFVERNWYAAQTLEASGDVVLAQKGSYMKVMERLSVKEILRAPNGDIILDFGQNLTGFVEFRVKGKQNAKVELRCFEVLDQKQNAYFDNLRKAKQKVVYYCKGDGEAVYAPYFTFQGFRYVLVSDWPGELDAESFVACVVYSQMEHTGYFECSNNDINQLVKNTLWSMKGNFLDVPTDCPQRNERVGWTGDAQIFCATACYLMNCHEFFRKWLVDLALDQEQDGGVPHIVPDIISDKVRLVEDWLVSRGTHSAAAWADAAVIIPWTLYCFYGDKSILEAQYESMKAWVSFMETHREGHTWCYRLQFGDWVALDAEQGSYFGATPEELVSSAYFAYSSRLMAKAAQVLGRKEAQKYTDLNEELAKGFRNKYINGDGSMNVKTQTAHILALHFGLVEDREKVADGLIELLEKENGHLVTGFVGTPYFCHALSGSGHMDAAYELLLKEGYPSWLYQVQSGATTIWEHWDGVRPDGSMWSPEMNSFNHYAYGAVTEWIFKQIGGIGQSEDSVGFENILIEAELGGGLSYSHASYASIYGEIAVHKKRIGNAIGLEVRIPYGTTAEVVYKGKMIVQLLPGKHQLEVAT